jgi:hypothetical protein
MMHLMLKVLQRQQQQQQAACYAGEPDEEWLQGRKPR